MSSVLSRLKERKLVQWAVAYLAGGWVLLEVIGFVGGYFHWPSLVVRGLIVAVAAGLPLTLILAWYHGEKGHQRVSGPELLMIGAVLAVGGTALALLAPDPTPGGTLEPDPRGAIRSIAVLPFQDVSTIEDGAYLSDGLTASITDRLSEIEGLRVVPRGVAAAYRAPAVDLTAVGRELSVQAVVTGQVGEADGRLVARAELIDLERMGQIWGAQFDRPLTDILAVQDSLVHDIARGLRVELSGESRQALTDQSTVNPEAYRLFLMSRFHNLSLTRTSWERGRRYAEEAVRLDPGYALAWAALSDSHVTGVFLGAERPEEGYPRARQAAETALALDESLDQAHVMLGFVRRNADWDWQGSRASFERALELDPLNADAWQGLSATLLPLGLTAEAVEAAERAAALDPLTPVITSWLGRAYVAAERYEEALDALQRSSELAPDNRLAVLLMPSALQGLGRHAEAVASLEERLVREGRDPTLSASMASLYTAQGRDREAREILARVDPERESHTDMARAWARLGEVERAFALLEEAIERREIGVWFLKTDPGFAALRDDPRWEAILERAGLEAGSSS